MGQTLTNGIYLPNEGERNCYSGLAANWNAVDTLKGNYSLHAINVDIHVTAAEKETWNGKADASALTAHTGDTTIHVTAEDKNKWNGKADASALTAHTGDTTIHVTAAEKETWNGKADASALTAHTGDTTIHVTSADKRAWDGHVADTVKHVTAEDKAKWDAVTSKADDSDVVHVTGDETVAGNKNFQGLLTTTPSESLWPTGLNTTDDITYLGREVIHLEYKSSGRLTDLSGGAWDVAALGAGCFFFRINNGKDIRYKNLATGDVNRIPVVSGTNRFINDVTPNQDNTYGLGSSSLRWRTINGLNPGSLGMPDLNNGIDISGYITVVANANKESFYTPPSNGWISVSLSRTSGIFAVLLIQGGMASSGRDTTRESGVKTADAMLPVVGGVQVSINSALADSVVSAYFYPCQGNI